MSKQLQPLNPQHNYAYVQQNGDGRKKAKRRSECRDETALAWLMGLSVAFSEFLGVAHIVFVAAGATDIVLALTGGATTLSSFDVGFAFAFVIFPLAYLYGQYESGEFNSAITISLYLDSLRDGFMPGLFWIMIVKLIAQFLGGLAGAALLDWYAGQADNALTLVNGAIGNGRTLFMESLLLTVLILIVLLAQKGKTIKPYAVAIWVGVSVAAFGASLNLFRTLGPAIVVGVYTNIWVYVAAHFIAIAAAWLLKNFLYRAQLMLNEQHRRSKRE